MKKNFFKSLVVVLFTFVAMLATFNPVMANSSSFSISGTKGVLTTPRALTAVGTTSLLSKGVVWSTSNPNMIKLSSTTGNKITVTAVGNGGATITATSVANRNVKATFTMMSDVGRPIGELMVGSLVSEEGKVYRVVDKSQPYGIGKTAISGFNASSRNYITLMVDKGFNDLVWSNNPADTYQKSNIGTILAAGRNLTTKMTPKVVRVSYETLNRQTKVNTLGVVFLPSLFELGYKYEGIENPLTEGKVFQAFTKGNTRPSSLWTRTRVRATHEALETDKAFQFVSVNVAVKDLVRKRSRIQPIVNVTPDVRVSYYQAADGTYPVR